jgi:8-amino-7-oxononanoate synthase
VGALDWIDGELADLHAQSRHRVLRGLPPNALNLSSNDYLGLAMTLKLDAAESASWGATASRLVAGDDPVFAELEASMAELEGAEACCFFSSGYMANIGVIPALVGRDDVVLSDRLNHACIIDGIAISRARHVRFQHCDMAHLEALLKRHGDKRCLIVSESIFSMDGDIAPLADLANLAERYGAMLMIDEAHSGGVFGEGGAGLVSALGLNDRVHVRMGTFSKAYGCYGAYVAGSRSLIDWLINRARSLIYTTGLPPRLVRVVQQAVKRAREEQWRRDALHGHADWFRGALSNLGMDIGNSASQIVPWLIGSDAETMAIADRLRESGIAAVAIRPPTVPEGTARIRFSLMATHERADLERVVAVLAAC